VMLSMSLREENGELSKACETSVKGKQTSFSHEL